MVGFEVLFVVAKCFSNQLFMSLSLMEAKRRINLISLVGNAATRSNVSSNKA